MRPCRTFLALAIATLWVAVGSHCLLGALPGLEFLSCCQHTESEQTPAHQEEDCAGDACSVIESGLYRLEKPQDMAIKPLLPLVAGLSTAPDADQSDETAFSVSICLSPPELSRTWQFSQRTALPPRAPSSVS
jgi:hypothetical protein